MTKPRFASLAEMEQKARNEADGMTHLRLTHNGYSTRWLTVRFAHEAGTFKYIDQIGIKHFFIDRGEAERLFAIEVKKG